MKQLFLIYLTIQLLTLPAKAQNTFTTCTKKDIPDKVLDIGKKQLIIKGIPETLAFYKAADSIFCLSFIKSGRFLFYDAAHAQIIDSSNFDMHKNNKSGVHIHLGYFKELQNLEGKALNVETEIEEGRSQFYLEYVPAPSDWNFASHYFGDYSWLRCDGKYAYDCQSVKLYY